MSKPQELSLSQNPLENIPESILSFLASKAGGWWVCGRLRKRCVFGFRVWKALWS